MIINHPLLGPRDASEFIYLGDAALMNRPTWKADLTDESNQVSENESESESKNKQDLIQQYHDYLYLRDNIAGEHRELWYHEQGDRSWLIVTRNTITHEISKVEMARDVKRGLNSGGAS